MLYIICRRSINVFKDFIMSERETLGSRLGFIMLSVGCAVGLGNVWRFPYITGHYGGGMFVLLYLLFLVLLGFPLLIAELSVGRGGGANLVGSVRNLASSDKKLWTLPFKIVFMGNFILMIYYTVVSGWLFAYTSYYLTNYVAKCKTPGDYGKLFDALCASPWESTAFMLGTVAVSSAVCSCGLQKGVEKSVKILMFLLFLLILLLAGYALTLPGVKEGMSFYLKPDMAKFTNNIGQTLYAAMGQAFFTLSIGVGSIAIFGSYIAKQRSLPGESVAIITIDTMIALLAGVIIFPCCFSFGVNPGSGPGLIFVSLPNTFAQMSGGRWWGALFFIFLAVAALTTVVAVFENLIAYLMDEWRFSRKKASFFVGIAVALGALPCVFGFNIWSSVHPLGKESTILDLEDFIVSQNLLPLGAVTLALFCSYKYGWGWENFVKEANTGKGLKFPTALKWYFRYLLPLLVLTVMFFGYKQLFS